MIVTSIPTKVSASCSMVQVIKNGTLRHTRSHLGCSPYLRLACSASHSRLPNRSFSTTSVAHLRDFFPPKDTAHILTTPAAWPHHGYTVEEMNAVVPAHRPPRGFGDWAAWKIVRFARYWMDKATGMDRAQKGDRSHPTTSIVAEKPLTEAQWVSGQRRNFQRHIRS